MGGRTGGNLWSPANCKLFGITVAADTVTGSARCVKPRTCASRCDGSGTCRVEDSEARESEIEGDDVDRRSPAAGTELISLIIQHSVRCELIGRVLLSRKSRGDSGYDELDAVGAVYMLGDCMSNEGY